MNALRVWLVMILLLACGRANAHTEAADANWRYRIQPRDTLITLPTPGRRYP